MKRILHFSLLFLFLLIINTEGQVHAQTVIWDTVAAGNNFTIALKSDGTVWTWGSNSSGQLGNSSNISSTTPVKVSTLTNIIGIAAGDRFSVALKNDGSVWTWGYNFYGQLGDNTTTNKNSPVQVNSMTNVKAVAAGFGHTVALKNDGTVWTWGNNYVGQLGDNTRINTKIPVQVQGQGGTGVITNCKAIIAGQDNTGALKDDGTVWVWGYNGLGTLGNNTTANSYTPVQVKGPGGTGTFTNCTAIAGGNYHIVALKSDGTVWAWGWNNYGQLGDNTTTDRSTPIQVKGQGGTGNLTGCKNIAAGYHHTIALKTDGTVWSWGRNDYGQLGDNSTIQRNTPVPVTINAGGTIKVTSGSMAYHTILLPTGQSNIFLTGQNTNGQLGNGSTTSNSTFTRITCGSSMGLPTATTTFSNQTLPATGTRLDLQSACYLATSITPNGTNPASGSLAAKLWVESSEPTTGSNSYTRRHWEITPATNPTTATGRVTLYVLQSEFDHFNASAATNKLPTGPNDLDGIGRLRIFKYSGTSSNGTGLPGSYSGAPLEMYVGQSGIVWNSTNNYWEISFNVTGFSGFFIGATNVIILPVKLTHFTAAKQAGTSVLNWSVAQEENIATYTIEHSADGRSFTTVGSVASMGNTTAARNYSYTDASPVKGANYYRLKIIEKDGKVSYSEIRLLNFGSQIHIALFPNPVKDKAVITGVEAGMVIRLLDAVGKVVLAKATNSTTETLAFGSLSKGFYSVQVYNATGQMLTTARLVKE